MSESKTEFLFGFPVVISDSIPKGTAIMGRWPTWQEVLLYGSFEKAIEAQKRQWVIINGLDGSQTLDKPEP